jgi:hypothetical protein
MIASMTRALGLAGAVLLAAASAAGAGAVDPVPRIESVHMSVKVFAVAKADTPDVIGTRRRVPRGTRIRVTLSDPGLLQLVAQSRAPGRVNARGDCVRETRRNHDRRSCEFLRPRMTILRVAREGRNRLRFTGRAPGVRLRPGPYVFTITASNGVEESEPETVFFRIVPR